MPIQQSKKQTDLEKRLKLLRQQIYGKSADQKVTISVNKDSNIPTSHLGELTHRYAETSIQKNNTQAIKSDISYLYQDLSKIGILASLALGLQIILFFLTKNHILNLNFF